MKKILLSWSQNRKAPNKAIDTLRIELDEFCQLFNSAPFPLDEATVEQQKNYVVDVVERAIERMERISRVKKGMLRMTVHEKEGDNKSYIWLMYGTDNGGIQLATITITLLREGSDPKKIDVFIGPQESGKTCKARELYGNKKALWIDGRSNWLKNPYIFSGLTAETEIIIIDDLSHDALVKAIFDLYATEELTVNEKLKKPFKVPRPKILLISSCNDSILLQDLSTRRRTNIVHFPLEGGKS